MTVRERILAIKLLEKQEKNPEYAKQKPIGEGKYPLPFFYMYFCDQKYQKSR